MEQTPPASEQLNLGAHRSTDSVWDRRGWNGSREQLTITRLLVGVGGGALAVQGWRLGTWKGRALSGIGTSLAWWELPGEGDPRRPRRWFNEVVERLPWSWGDRVMDESAASFP